MTYHSDMSLRSALPKHLTVRSVLQARLVREMSPNDRLPSETTLCQEFGVSRITMQRALGLLEAEGWIRREQGRGTFFIGQQSTRLAQKTSELLETLLGAEASLKIKVIKKNVQEPSPQIREKLGLPEGSRIVAIERLALVDGEPLVYIYTYLPYGIGEKFLFSNASMERMTIAAELADKFGIEILSVEQTISATLADPNFSNELGVELGAPVLEGQRLYYGAKKTPIFCTTAFYRADRHSFVVRLSGWRTPGRTAKPPKGS